jgi:hypothetical protein
MNEQAKKKSLELFVLILITKGVMEFTETVLMQFNFVNTLELFSFDPWLVNNSIHNTRTA